MIISSEWESVGSLAAKAKIAVTDAGISYTIPAGKLGVTFQNQGTTKVWYGDSAVDPANNKGVYLLPNQTITYKNVRRTFAITFKTTTSETGTIGTCEHD